MKQKLIILRVGVVALVVVQLVLAMLTLYDVATAKGIGLYFSILSGNDNKVFFDRLSVTCGMLALIAVLLIPYLLLQHKGIKALCRMTILFFAFMPVLDIGMLVHLGDGHPLLVFAPDWQRGWTFLSSYLREILPALIVLVFLYKERHQRFVGWHRIVFGIEMLLSICVFVMPQLAELAGYISCYLLVVLAYDWWEKVEQRDDGVAERVIRECLLALIYGRGILKMIDLMIHSTL